MKRALLRASSRKGKAVHPSSADADKTTLRLATLVRDSNDAVIIRNGKGRIISWNRGAEEIYGYSKAEALGMNIRRLIPRNKRGETQALVRILGRGRTVPSLETQRCTKDGRILDVWLTATALVNRHGAAMELATTERDVTERNQARRELHSLHEQVVSAQETERKRLSRDLHDGIGQTLSGIKFRLESLSDKILSHPGEARRGIARVTISLDRAISEIRRVSQNLLPSELEDLGLRPAIVSLCREFRERLGIPVAVRCAGAPRTIDPHLALALFRIAQEALSNVGKHANATRAALSIRRKGRSIELAVTDNGRGYDAPEKTKAGHGMGLSSIRERVQSVGGTINFHSALGQGTKLVVRAPLVHGNPNAR